MNKLIIFEGIDGTGKTTLAKKIKESIPGTSYFRPSKTPFDSKKNFEEACRYDWAHLFDFLEQINFERPIILDRSPISQYVYSKVFRQENIDKYFKLYGEYEEVFDNYITQLKKNFNTIFVYCSREVININDPLNPHINSKNSKELSEMYQYFYKNFIGSDYLELKFEDGIQVNFNKLDYRIITQFFKG